MIASVTFDAADLAHLPREDRKRIAELLDFSTPAARERVEGRPERCLAPDREVLRAHGYTADELPKPWARLDDGRGCRG
jgi:hypothetical protein